MNKSWLMLLSLAAAMASAAGADPRAELAKKLPGKVSLEDIRATPMPGIYEVSQGGDVAYVSADGRYYIVGDLIDIKSEANLTENRRLEVRRKLLAQVPESDMLIYGKPASPYTVTVFTDVDCGYCRKLHSQMEDYNRLGIRVRYLFYPREGPGSQAWKTAEAVWCSADRKEALTRAKLGGEIKAACSNNPVAREYKLGRSLGIRGTPAIFTQGGEMLPGYLPPTVLLARLQSAKK